MNGGQSLQPARDVPSAPRSGLLPADHAHTMAVGPTSVARALGCEETPRLPLPPCSRGLRGCDAQLRFLHRHVRTHQVQLATATRAACLGRPSPSGAAGAADAVGAAGGRSQLAAHRQAWLCGTCVRDVGRLRVHLRKVRTLHGGRLYVGPEMVSSLHSPPMRQPLLLPSSALHARRGASAAAPAGFGRWELPC
jgi:hypothetical protein